MIRPINNKVKVLNIEFHLDCDEVFKNFYLIIDRKLDVLSLEYLSLYLYGYIDKEIEVILQKIGAFANLTYLYLYLGDDMSQYLGRITTLLSQTQKLRTLILEGRCK